MKKMYRLFHSIMFCIFLVLNAVGCTSECVVNSVSEKSESSEKPLSYYCFGAKIPPKGFCESKVFGGNSFVAEPVNLAFSMFGVALGLFSMFLSRKTHAVFQITDSLLIGWGLFAAMYHFNLANGMYRMMDVAISFLQAFIVLLLIRSLCVRAMILKPKSAHKIWIVSAVSTCIFTLYPATVHVLGESSSDPWVAWLVFDLLWFVIVGLLIAVWILRNSWPTGISSGSGFRLLWHAIIYCILAYSAWAVDNFICTEATAYLGYLFLHGWWHFFMGLCFFSLISLCKFLLACEVDCIPIVKRFPQKGPFGMYFVNWKNVIKKIPS